VEQGLVSQALRYKHIVLRVLSSTVVLIILSAFFLFANNVSLDLDWTSAPVMNVFYPHTPLTYYCEGDTDISNAVLAHLPGFWIKQWQLWMNEDGFAIRIETTSNTFSIYRYNVAFIINRETYERLVVGIDTSLDLAVVELVGPTLVKELATLSAVLNARRCSLSG